jgi:hypothetical protein
MLAWRPFGVCSPRTWFCQKMRAHIVVRDHKNENANLIDGARDGGATVVEEFAGGIETYFCVIFL